MVQIQFFYRIDTYQIDALYIDCKSNSTIYKDTNVYVEVNVTDPIYTVSRDHKVILDGEGNVIDTEEFINPTQPTPTPNPHQGALDDLNAGFAGTGTPDKIDTLKEALLYLLGA